MIKDLVIHLCFGIPKSIYEVKIITWVWLKTPTWPNQIKSNSKSHGSSTYSCSCICRKAGVSKTKLVSFIVKWAFLRITGLAKQVVIFLFLYNTYFFVFQSTLIQLLIIPILPMQTLCKKIRGHLNLDELGIPQLITFWWNNNPSFRDNELVLINVCTLFYFYEWVCRIVRQRVIPFHSKYLDHLQFSRLYHCTMLHCVGLFQKKPFYCHEA